MINVLGAKFFNRDTTLVAQELLGKFLVRRMNGREVAVMITETEAYDGLRDKASHASKGKTARTKIMFGPAGNFYIYLVYGVYYMLNVVTREDGYPAAVLIRGAKPLTNSAEVVSGLRGQKISRFHLDGPGKLAKFLNVNKSFNGKLATRKNNLWFEDRGVKISAKNIKKLPRVGVTYAGSVWSAKKWRFVLKT